METATAKLCSVFDINAKQLDLEYVDYASQQINFLRMDNAR